MTEIADQGHFDSHQEKIDKVVWSLLQNHDRMDTGRSYLSYLKNLRKIINEDRKLMGLVTILRIVTLTLSPWHL